VKLENSDVDEFLSSYPEMALAPSRTGDILLSGIFRFRAQYLSQLVEDSYHLKIEIPRGFPRHRPRVWELDQRVPNDGKHHVNPDGTLCLGSPLRVLRLIRARPTIMGFVSSCLIPFLFAISKKRLDGKPFFMGELRHGEAGIIDDYRQILNLRNKEQVLAALALAGTKKRQANKKPCPCGCGNRLGSCKLRFALNDLRYVVPRSWFRHHISTLGREA
jgi:hypothetical protein